MVKKFKVNVSRIKLNQIYNKAKNFPWKKKLINFLIIKLKYEI